MPLFIVGEKRGALYSSGSEWIGEMYFLIDI
jgi:hypothetical protein